MGLIGELRLWNVAAGMSVNPLISVLAGYGANTNTVILDRTGEYPYVSRAFREAKVTTVITSATMLSGIVYYQVYPNVYIGGGLGHLTLKGEHQSNHPRARSAALRWPPSPPARWSSPSEWPISWGLPSFPFKFATQCEGGEHERCVTGYDRWAYGDLTPIAERLCILHQ